MNLTKKYTNFRKNANFVMPPLEQNNGAICFCGEVVEDEASKYAEGEKFLNVGYNFKNHSARMLSNLFPYEFVFKGKKVKSIEGVLQGIKYQDKKIQNKVLGYAGLDAYHTRGANSKDFWGESGILFWQGKPINRHSEDYQLFIDELYISAIKNPLYKKALLSSPDKYLLHHIGNNDKTQTILTRFELEERLNTLKQFLIEEEKNGL